jgi:hypothetical protein
MIILNELEYAENCLRNNCIGDNPYTTLSILSKYYYHHLGYKKPQIIAELTGFISSNYPKYYLNKDSWNDSIEKLASNAKKFTLYEIEGAWITEEELNTIHNINNKVLERLAFTMLCLAKLALRKNSNANGWINEDVKTIFSLARISGSTTDRYIRISQLNEMGIIELPKKNDLLSYRLTFINEESENVLFIHDFRELGYEYLKYCGQNIIRCAECGILVRGNKAGTKRYCSSCAAYTPQENKKIICIDCGKEFSIDARVMNKCRCDECQKIKVREDTRLRVQRLRNKK